MSGDIDREYVRVFASLWIPHPPVKHRPARKKNKRMPVLALTRHFEGKRLSVIRRPVDEPS